MKKCNQCGEEKRLDEFYKHNGRATTCRKCRQDYEQGRYAVKEKRVNKKTEPLKGKLHCERNGGKTIKSNDCLRGVTKPVFTAPIYTLKICSDFISPEETKAMKYNDRVHNEVYPNHYLVI
jgi:hypothetical protein